ncbi:beta-ketoacyl-[acyl-carrier-protein] synthase family protein [Salinisphaera sp.]|uniref:beta-ketoacyl-[acyl-carrier-protein] synthase family protein n=1 Tax=Salinisphaera sp. TaxID=1914330 RepID=UPI002D7957EF|nr:beta-ketoacyl-[acyl-carrier-protein] synthase family protein [Salinisphaera sp.]HET7315700.1 beta-ketoacyl-[acyl-carrier-protein] synthase family protein [Salinisphaera sp.]
MKPLAIHAYTATTALGAGRAALWRGLRERRSGLVPCDFEGADLATWIGRVAGCEQVELPVALADWHCRNNQLAELALCQDGFIDAVNAARARHAPERIGLFLGTSTSGIATTERAYREIAQNRLPAWFSFEHSHDYFALCGYVQRRLGLAGPALTISTACSSSAKVFASAARSIESGFCDVAVVGGVDSLCLTTLYGFNSLQLISPEPCRPWDAARSGISIGEAGGFALIGPANEATSGPRVAGIGESGDAHHMAAPEPDGQGAALAMRRALDDAGVDAAAVDYVNLHGTATRANDQAEDRAIVGLFGEATPASSTKGWTGHTLGAAGIVEAVIGCLALEHDYRPATLNTIAVDETLRCRLLTEPLTGGVRRVLSNAFGFGGSNCSLLLDMGARR